MVRLRPLSLSLRAAPLVPAALLGAALAMTGSARAEPVSAEYDVYFGGFHVLKAEALWQPGAEDYRIAAEATTEGFLGWFSSWKGVTESHGRIVGGQAVPQRHENRSNSDDGEKMVVLTYDAGGDIADSLVEPPLDLEERHPLPANAGEGTLDPLSVMAGLSRLLQDGGRCEGSFAVFDGRKRYDLTVTDAGARMLEPSDYSIFTGEARGCRLDYKMLGGHRIERSKYTETARKRIIWVASPSEGAPRIPVRLEIETAYGTIVGHLTGFGKGLSPEAKLTE